MSETTSLLGATTFLNINIIKCSFKLYSTLKIQVCTARLTPGNCLQRTEVEKEVWLQGEEI